MPLEERALSFRIVDDVSLAANESTGDLPSLPRFTANSLGPFAEFRHAQMACPAVRSLGNSWIDQGDLDELWSRLAQGETDWARNTDRRAGFFRTRQASRDESSWTRFALGAKRAGIASGLTSDWAGQIVAALDELMTNVAEHSRAPASGFAAYAQGQGKFEILVADEGIGVLESLRSGSDFGELRDHGDALKLFIEEGVSRHGLKVGRGMGFRPLFVGLANTRSTLRFRTGDHALEVDGEDLCQAPARLVQTIPVAGLLCSVVCHGYGN